LNVDLQVTFNNVTVKLNLNESLVIINALAIRRSQIRGGKWSAVGKNIQTPLPETMCVIYAIPKGHYGAGTRMGLREVDFTLWNKHGKEIKCEVK